MENQKSQAYLQQYHGDLNNLIYSPNYKKLQQFLKQTNRSFSELEFSSDNSFLGRVEWSIMVAKRKILEELFLVYKDLKQNELQELIIKIRGLISTPQRIIREGIIGIYSDIALLRDAFNGKTRPEFQGLLQRIVGALQPLLRYYFIFKQMEKNDRMLAGGSLGMILSEKMINCSDSLASIKSTHSIKQMISDRALRQIKHNIQLKSIKQLIQKQLQQNQVQDIEETCRICRNSFKVSVLQKHLQFCSNIQTENAKREEIFENQLRTIAEMKEEIQNQKSDLPEQELQIYKRIISQFEPIRSFKRESSARLKLIAAQIEQYCGTNSLLSSFHQQSRQLQLIEKKILSLSAHHLYLNIQNPVTVGKRNQYRDLSPQIRSSQSCKTKKSIRTKKSLFARKQESEESNYDSRTAEFTGSQIRKFHSIKGHMEEICDSNSESDLQEKAKLHKSLSNFAQKEEEEKSNEISIDDFDILKFLGKGAFGKVYLVRRKKTQDIYALKVIKMQQNWDQKQLTSLKNEHEILSQIAGEHLVKAAFSFSEGQVHFFVLEYMPGGDLAKVIQEQVYLDYEQSRFYLAEIVLAIERLHEMGIIHRDLKPENLIFNEQGHLKLTDFGLSQIRIGDKIRKAKRSTIANFQERKLEDNQGQTTQPQITEGKKKVKLIGTPDYIAPEIIKGQSLDNLSIDWWSLGVIAYQMMIGCRPFCANTVDEVISNIEQFKIQWPAIGEQENEISPVAADFIQKLLNPNYFERLGSKGIEEIKEHPFFQGMNWTIIKTMKPPLTPAVDPIENYEYAEDMPDLRLEIRSMIGNYQAKSSLKLDNFIRYDLLVQETLSSAGKRIVRRSNKIKKLKSIASNFSSVQENKGSHKYFEEGSVEQETEKGWSNFRND